VVRPIAQYQRFSFRTLKGKTPSLDVDDRPTPTAMLFAFAWLFFATAYTTPAKKPTPTADTDPAVTGSPKNIMPEAATGNLFRAPTMLW
jgi:hypothetical protein